MLSVLCDQARSFLRADFLLTSEVQTTCCSRRLSEWERDPQIPLESSFRRFRMACFAFRTFPFLNCDGRFEKSERLARTTRQAELCESCRVCHPVSASACVAGCSKEVWVTYSFGCPSPLPRSGELRLVSRQRPRLECLERRLPRRLGSAGTKEYRHERSRFAVPVRVQARRRRQFQQLARLTC